MSRKISRRQFFRLSPLDWSEQLHKKKSPPLGDTPVVEVPPRFIHPPGANKDTDVFRKECDGCKRCSEACEYSVIIHLKAIEGKYEGLPVLLPNENPCRWCPSMDCIAACPSGALKKEEKCKPIAKAHLRMESCLTSEGILCDSCALFCPNDIGAIRIVERKPLLDVNACIGCGLCAFHCDAEPGAIDIQSLVA